MLDSQYATSHCKPLLFWFQRDLNLIHLATISACDRRTDRQTDGRTDCGYTAKNYFLKSVSYAVDLCCNAAVFFDMPISVYGASLSCSCDGSGQWYWYGDVITADSVNTGCSAVTWDSVNHVLAYVPSIRRHVRRSPGRHFVASRAHKSRLAVDMKFPIHIHIHIHRFFRGYPWIYPWIYPWTTYSLSMAYM